MKFFAIIVLIALVVIALFLLFADEQAKEEFIHDVQVVLRLLVRIMSIFFDLTLKVLNGLMAIEEGLLGEATPAPATPSPTPTLTPGPTPTPATPTPLLIEPHPSGKEIIKCFGGMFFILIFVSLAVGVQQVIRFIAKIFS